MFKGPVLLPDEERDADSLMELFCAISDSQFDLRIVIYERFKILDADRESNIGFEELMLELRMTPRN